MERSDDGTEWRWNGSWNGVTMERWNDEDDGKWDYTKWNWINV